MNKYFQYQYILLGTLLTLAPFLATADNILGQDDISDFHFEIPPDLSNNYLSGSGTHSNFLMSGVVTVMLSTDVVDSVIYTQSGITYKDIYTYDSSVQILTILKQKFQDYWKNYKLSTFVYYNTGDLQIELYENWDEGSGVWVSNERKTSEYDDNGNKIFYLYENWDSDKKAWINKTRYTSSYESNGNWITYQKDSWNTTNQSWIQDWFVTFTYDENGKTLTQLWDYYAANTKDWLYTFTYDSTGNRLSYLRSFREPYTTEWINFYQYLYSYNLNNNIVIDQSEFWDIYNSAWLKSSRTVFTYDTFGNLIEDISEAPGEEEGTWKGSYRNFYSIDDNNNLVAALTEKWDILDSIWVDYSRAKYEYDDNENLIYFFNENWTGLYWDPKFKSISIENNGNMLSYTCEEFSAFYSPLTGIDTEENSILNSFSLSQNYPNPFNPETMISYQLSTNSYVDLSVYNSLGQKITTLVSERQSSGVYKIIWNATSFPSGLYFYNLKTGIHYEVRKMMLMK